MKECTENGCRSTGLCGVDAQKRHVVSGRRTNYYCNADNRSTKKRVVSESMRNYAANGWSTEEKHSVSGDTKDDAVGNRSSEMLRAANGSTKTCVVSQVKNRVT